MSARRRSSSGPRPVAGRLWAISRGAAWVGAVFGALPFALLSIAERRFGGRAPWSGLDQLEADVGSGSMTGLFDGWTISLRDSLMAEMVIRLVVTIGWAAVIAVAVTTLREVAHLANDPRRWVTSVDPVSAGDRRRVTGAPARAIAMGVLALLPAPASAFASRPMFTPAGWDVVNGDVISGPFAGGRVISEYAINDAGVMTDRADSSVRDSSPRDSSPQDSSLHGGVECNGAVAAGPSERDQRVTEGATGAANIDRCLETHVVRAGESIYSIASDLVARAAGPEVGAPTSGGVTRVAGLLLDLNLGRAMSGDEVFESPAHIEPGWVLRLPGRDVVRGKDSDSGVVANSVESSVTGTVTVAEGDTLSGLVAEHLGSETDWREVYAWNAGREMGDGRTFDDPGLIIPGWVLHLEPPGLATPGAEADGDVVEVFEDIGVVDDVDDVDVEIVDVPPFDVSDVDDVDSDVDHVDLEHVDPEPADLDQTDPEQADPDQADPENVADSDAADSGAVDSSLFRWLGAVLVGAGLLAGLRARRRRRLRALPSRPLPVRVSHEVSGSVGHDSSVDHDPSVEHGPAPSLERVLIAGDAQNMSPSLDAAVRSLVDLLLRNGPVGERAGLPICSGIGFIEFAADRNGEQEPRVHVELLDGRLNQDLDDPALVAEPAWEVESSSRLRSLGAPEPVVGVFPMPLLVEIGVRSTTTNRVFVDLESVDALVVDDADMARAVVASVLASPYTEGMGAKLTVGGDVLPRESAEIAALSMLATAVSREFVLDEGSNEGSEEGSDEGSSEGSQGPQGVSGSVSTSALARWHDRLVLGESAEGQISLQLGDQSNGERVRLEVIGRATTGVVARLDREGTLRFVCQSTEPGAGRTADRVPCPEPVLIDAHRLTAAQISDIARGLGGFGGLDEVLGDGIGDEPRDVLDDAPHDEVASPDEAHEVQDTSQWDVLGALDGRDEPAVAPEPINHLGPSFIVRLFGDVRVEAHGDTPVNGQITNGQVTNGQVTNGQATNGASISDITLISDVTFEKSKSVELLAWMVTHRERSTRAKARSAMWETRVAASTFANVVSDARRSLARAVTHDDGDWIERTMTEELRLAPGIVSDAELMVEVRDLIAGREPGGGPNGQDSNGQDPDDQHVEARLRYVLGLIRGMPFEGTAYLWPDPEGITSELVMLATGLATELAERCLARGDLDGVVWATGQGLRVLPGHEGLIALRLRARASTGDLAGVRQEWASYERVLADDWGGGEPAPELVALRRELLTR